MLRTIRRAALVGALGTAVGLGAGTASASAAAKISGLPDKAPLVNQLFVPVTIVVTCGPPTPDPFPFPPFTTASVTIRQVVSRRHIAHGTASVNNLTCDNEPHAYTLNVFPDTGGFPGGADSLPFKRGDAVISAQASTGFETVTAGPQTIRLTR